MSRQFGFAQDPEGMQCSNSGPPQMTDEQIAALMAGFRQSQPDVFADLQQQAAQSMPVSQQAYGQAESHHMPVDMTRYQPSVSFPSASQPPAQALALSQLQQIASGSKTRNTSRHYTPKETATIAKAWVEFKPILDDQCKNAPDKKAAWLGLQARCYELSPSLLPDFSDLHKIKHKVSSLTATYQKSIENMKLSGGAGAAFRETEAFEVLEASDAARDPLVRHEGLLDKTRPTDRFNTYCVTHWRGLSSLQSFMNVG